MKLNIVKSPSLFLAIILCIGLGVAFLGNAKPTELACGDLLTRYATKPQNLAFIGCKKHPNAQTIIEAEYRVSGRDSQQVEEFFVEHYGMAKLKVFPHTGWEPSGNGSIQADEVTRVNPNYSISINMWGYARSQDPAVHMLLKRHEVEYFTVLVSVLDI